MKSSIKILIVDDDRSSAALLSEVVKRMGFKAIVASKVTDGLNVVKLQTVHAAIIDVMLPKMSGVDLTVEFRKTQFGENPVVLVSGVFKDKAFATEAMRKSGAIDFLFKPYAAEDLMNSLKTALASHLVTERWDLPALLTRRLSTVRERSKAIEHLEPIKGNDVPFVMSILMEAEISGHLNLVSDDGEIFGITLSKGTISEVDSTESQSTSVLNLISNGFLAQEDWDIFERHGKRKFPLERLVHEGLVSPHAISVAKHEQILSDFKTIVTFSGMQLNFVRQEDSSEPPKHAVTMKELMKLMAPSMDEFFPASYLEQFYAPVMSAPLQVMRSNDEFKSLFATPLFSPWSGLREVIEKGGTLGAALEKHRGHAGRILSCLHYLVLSRTVGFGDVNVAQTMGKLLERYTELFNHLNGQTADRVFKYFSGTERATANACEKIYEEYLKANHPDKLPKEATPQIRDLANKCLEIMTAAKAIMTSDEERIKLFESLKSESNERLRQSNELTYRALEVLRKGQPKAALEIAKSAAEVHPSTLQVLIQIWAEVKSGSLANKAQLQERLKRLDNLATEDKRTSYYHMVLGLVKKSLGDPQATACFERVLQLDSSFAEARRELNRIAAKDKKIDLLTGDLTEIVSQLFRRKAE